MSLRFRARNPSGAQSIEMQVFIEQSLPVIAWPGCPSDPVGKGVRTQRKRCACAQKSPERSGPGAYSWMIRRTHKIR
jgi:hypothetical protein